MTDMPSSTSTILFKLVVLDMFKNKKINIHESPLIFWDKQAENQSCMLKEIIKQDEKEKWLCHGLSKGM